MALGPLIQIAMRVAMVAGQAVGRAAVEAYKEAAAGRGAAAAAARKATAARRKMTPEEASKILGDLTAADGEEAIMKRFQTLHDLNAATDNSAGSPYLQQKVEVAKKILISDIEKPATPGSTEDAANKARAKAEGDK